MNDYSVALPLLPQVGGLGDLMASVSIQAVWLLSYYVDGNGLLHSSMSRSSLTSTFILAKVYLNTIACVGGVFCDDRVGILTVSVFFHPHRSVLAVSDINVLLTPTTLHTVHPHNVSLSESYPWCLPTGT